MNKQLEILKEQMESLEKRFRAAKTEYEDECVKMYRAQLFDESDMTVFDLCDEIHYLVCGYNHTDGCGYGYGQWEKGYVLDRYGARGQELEYVNGYLKKYPVEKIVKVLQRLREIKKEFPSINISRKIFEEALDND